MVSKSQIKLIRSLHQKKNRHSESIFIAEGVKVISELLPSKFNLVQLYVTEDIFPDIQPNHKTLITAGELAKMSALTTPSNCLAVFEIPDPAEPQLGGLVVALDDIRDPGNLGTIIRLCDWFGVKTIICSEETADIYNPKVIQASMGSVARVDVHYLNLLKLFSSTRLQAFGTYMDGANIYNTELPQEGIIVFGNEANGISDEVTAQISNKISIPRFGDIQETESLNVAAATAIILSEFRRKY